MDMDWFGARKEKGEMIKYIITSETKEEGKVQLQMLMYLE